MYRLYARTFIYPFLSSVSPFSLALFDAIFAYIFDLLILFSIFFCIFFFFRFLFCYFFFNLYFCSVGLIVRRIVLSHKKRGGAGCNTILLNFLHIVL